MHAHLGDVEKWFIKRGLPHFIEDYKATDDVFNRALPLVVLLIVVQMGFELSSHSVTWANRGLGAALGIGAVLVLFLIANLARQPHAWYKWPRKVGVVEMTVLVALGPAVGMAVRASHRAVAADLAANIVVLIVVYALVAYAVLPVIIWALQHSVKELSNLVNLASKALPMLALFGTFLFLNVDMWHIAAFLPRHQLWVTVGFFAVVTFLFLLARLPEEVRRLSGEYTREAVVLASADTPLVRHVEELDAELHPIVTNRRQRINMLFVLAFTQIIQVLLLSLVVFAYFVTLGKLAVSNDQVADWLKIKEGTDDYERLISGPGTLFGVKTQYPWLHGSHVVFSTALLQTAILLTTFSAFFFAVSAVTDEAYRKDFFESITGKLVKSLSIRCGYLNLYIKASRELSAGRGRAHEVDAQSQDHLRTLHVPILADPQVPDQHVDAFAPPIPQQHYPDGSNPFQPQGIQAPVTPSVPSVPSAPPSPGLAPHEEDPFLRWPQQQ